MKNIIRSAITLLFIGCFLYVSHSEETSNFPWLMTIYKYEHLTKQQKNIYLYAYFETVGFILYGYTNQKDSSAMKTINAWIDCIMETKGSEKWSPYIGWIFGNNIDKSPAYILLNQVSPIVCEGYEEKAGTKLRALTLYDYTNWENFSIKDKSVYISGYIDTAASLEMRLKDAGIKNNLRDLQIVIEATGIDGILSDVMKTQFEKNYPLPWSISRGLGAAHKRVFSDD